MLPTLQFLLSWVCFCFMFQCTPFSFGDVKGMKNVLLIKWSIEFTLDITSYKNTPHTEAHRQAQQNSIFWKGIGINYSLHIHYQNIDLIKSKLPNIHIIPQNTKSKLPWFLAFSISLYLYANIIFACCNDRLE